MTAFDLGALAIVVLSTLFAFARGVIRELVALLAWILGIFAAITFTPLVGGWLPDSIPQPALRYLAAFTIILIAALLAGAVVAWPLAKAVRAAGLGFVDRFLGGVFGVARGVIVTVAAVLLAGLTGLPRASWWQDSLLAAPLVAAALMVAANLPRAWADALDYSRTGRKPGAGTLRA